MMTARTGLLLATMIVVGAAIGPAAAAPAGDDTVRYTFDGAAPLADVSGHGHDLTPVSRHGGSFATVAHGGGSALAFPPPCHAEPCPRIALRATDTTGLNPGRRPIRYGAAVRLRSDETTKGENVLQKGYSARGSQYKLQIDGAAGHPSCVLVGGTQLTILVDGVRRGSVTVPAELSVTNRLPFSVGGKGSYLDNDQFQGTLDEVWVDIG
jgi:hypothetical protein